MPNLKNAIESTAADYAKVVVRRLPGLNRRAKDAVDGSLRAAYLSGMDMILTYMAANEGHEHATPQYCGKMVKEAGASLGFGETSFANLMNGGKPQ